MSKLFSYALLAVLAFSGIALALPANEVTTTYYSDATHTTVVGERTLLCQGGFSKWGKVTNWADSSSEPCNPRRR